MDKINTIKPWMYRKENEFLYLLLSLFLLVIAGWLFSLINIWWTLIIFVLILIYIQLEQAKYLGNSLRVHKEQFPDLYDTFVDFSKKLNIHKANLYIRQDPYLNAHAIGIDSCSVVLSSALVEQLSVKELEFVIAHELGHFALGHTKITSLLVPLDFGNTLINLFLGVWRRQTEYSCDQCGLLLTKDIDSATNAIIKLSVGGNLFEKVSMKGYLSQIKKADQFRTFVSELLETHPLLTNRVKNLVNYWRDNFKTL